jgi:hypothetical protein
MGTGEGAVFLIEQACQIEQKFGPACHPRQGGMTFGNLVEPGRGLLRQATKLVPCLGGRKA